ncbi:MAG: Asp-tRNA(Asn)/Glu-tRNA(Gln) amidotransferase GatCAB subunit B, partial [Chloroflexaceae bacterium]|nr:Asp-tRNA(Asn)/Glu-tRNA(Gln) amidotransferase GatCAB subunit B [Chloroflexaceae bacterium]
EAQGITVSQRSKESAHDYRYFPEPDIPPLVLDDAWIAARRAEMPELPDARRDRFMAEYGLSKQDAELLTMERPIADYYVAAVTAAAQRGGSAKDVANWVGGELFRLLKDAGEGFEMLHERMPPLHIAEVLGLLAQDIVNRTVAKQVFEESFQTGNSPAQIVDEQGLKQISDTGALAALAQVVIANNPKAVEEYRKGKKTAIKFLVGQVMKATKGQANPQAATTALETILDTEV